MIDLLIKMMEVDSTSGKEENIVGVIQKHFSPERAVCEIQDIPNGKKNVYYKWGNPEIIF